MENLTLRQQLVHLCEHPPKTQPDYEHQNFVNIVTAVTKHLFDNHKDEFVKNFTSWGFRSRKASDPCPDITVISEFKLSESRIDLYDETLKLGYFNYSFDTSITVSHYTGGNSIVVECDVQFKNPDNGRKVDSIPIKEMGGSIVRSEFNTEIELLSNHLKPIEKYGAVFEFWRNQNHLIHRQFGSSDGRISFCLTLI